MFRCDDTNRRMVLHVGFSDDGLHWDIDPNPLRFECEDKEIGEWVYGYDPRVTFIEDRYYVTLVQRLSWPDHRRGVDEGLQDVPPTGERLSALQPQRRALPPKDQRSLCDALPPVRHGTHAFGDIFYSESPDMEFWGRHRHVMAPAAFEKSAWQCMKIGAGPIPIETSEGWLLFYHGVLHSCNGYVYSFGTALLDRDEPRKPIYRSGPYLISPQKLYECVGDVPNVCFPCAELHDPATGRVAVYYGCADTVTGIAFGYIPEIQVDAQDEHHLIYYIYKV